MKIYNKRRENFETDGEYDLYLEEIEDIIFNLTEGIDIQETEARINQYKRNNKRIIALNNTKKEEERKEMYKKAKAKDIELREENREFYDEDEEMEDKKADDEAANQNKVSYLSSHLINIE